MSNDIKFVDGLIVKAPNEKAPDFVKMAISIKRHDLINWLTAQDGDWINIDVKESKGGKWYCAVNDFQPKQQAAPAPLPPLGENEFFDDGVPFMRPYDEYFG